MSVLELDQGLLPDTEPDLDLERDLATPRADLLASDLNYDSSRLDALRKNDEILKLGAEGEAVEAFTRRMNDWRELNGLEKLEVDKVFDTRDQQAVEEFQSRHALSLNDASLIKLAENQKDIGLAVDGIVGPRTMRALDLATGHATETLDYNDFREVTGGVWDISQVSDPAYASDLPLPASLRERIAKAEELTTAENLREEYGHRLPEEFFDGMARIAAKHDIPESWLWVPVIADSNVNPEAKNKQDGRLVAAGFFQGTRVGLAGLSVETPEELSKLGAMGQLDVFEEYVDRAISRREEKTDKPLTAGDMFNILLAPGAMGKHAQATVYSGGLAVAQNKPVDGDRDGRIKNGEITSWVAGRAISELS